MSYYNRFFPVNPDPTNWSPDGQYIGTKFYALVQVNKVKNSKVLSTFWHTLLTAEQLEQLEKDKLNPIDIVSKLAKKADGLSVSEKSDSGKLLHVFGPGKTGEIETEDISEK